MSMNCCIYIMFSCLIFIVFFVGSKKLACDLDMGTPNHSSDIDHSSDYDLSMLNLFQYMY